MFKKFEVRIESKRLTKKFYKVKNFIINSSSMTKSSKDINEIRYGPQMKVLIIGAGVAGLTLGALLQQRGFSPKIVERAPAFGHVGYVIVIWPSGSRVLKGLGLYEQLEEVGCPFTKYNVFNYKGELIKNYNIDKVAEKYGPIISIYRPELIDLLSSPIKKKNLKMNTMVSSITQTEKEAIVEFENGKKESFDIVIGCDGVRSKTRTQVLGEKPLAYSGMSGWGFWVDPELSKTEGIVEYWGKGKFFGLWPTKGKLAAFTSIKVDKDFTSPKEIRIDQVRENFKEFKGIIPEILKQLDDPDKIFFDNYNDLKINTWSSGRVVLVGDSAHAILPNAGAGVSMALESAAVMADELCRTDSKYFSHAFHQYEKRRRSRVSGVQDQSRIMGKLIYTDSDFLSNTRDKLMRLYTSNFLFKHWDKILSEPL